MYHVHSGTRRVHTCMYSVHTRAIDMPWANHYNIAVLCPGLCPGQSPPVLLVCTKGIFNRSHTYRVQHWYILIYSTVPPCTALYRYILPCTTVHDPEDFLFSIWYFVRRELNSQLEHLKTEKRKKVCTCTYKVHT